MADRLPDCSPVTERINIERTEGGAQRSQSSIRRQAIHRTRRGRSERFAIRSQRLVKWQGFAATVLLTRLAIEPAKLLWFARQTLRPGGFVLQCVDDLRS